MKTKIAIEFVVSVDNEGRKYFLWKTADEIQFVGEYAEIYLDGKEIETIHISDISQIIPSEIKSAQIVEGEIAVFHSVRVDVGREFLSWEISGWDEVKKYTKKVLLFDGRKFTFSCWNSDRMEIVFVRGLNSDPQTAKIVSE